MHNPIRGVVTSEHEDHGGYRRHRGRDIGTRDADPRGNPVWVYGVGRPVYAAFGGHWKKIVRWSKPGNRKDWTWATERTGNGGLVGNPDGEGQGYNHVLILPKWKEGDWINEGELIGHLDLSGNMTAPHLHFETWRNWRDPYSDFSPKILFDKYRIDTMADPAPLHPSNSTTITVHSAGIDKSTGPSLAVGKPAEEGELTMSQYEDLKKDIAELNRKLEIIMRSTSTAVISDQANGDTVTVAGALTRSLALSRQIKAGAGCKADCPLKETPIEDKEA